VTVFHPTAKNEKKPQKIEPQFFVIFLLPFAVGKALASASLLGCHFILPRIKICEKDEWRFSRNRVILVVSE
jgi:hypothetical protein